MRITPAVAAEDLRALAEVVPFDRRTRDLLHHAADLLDPEDRTCGNLRRTGIGEFRCDLPQDHAGVHQQSGGPIWDNAGELL